MTEPTKDVVTAPSAAFQAVMKFCKDHSAATRLLLVATQDYAASRCLAQNLLITSLILGAQALEKYLKAYLLLENPDRNVRTLSHSLPRLLGEVDRLAPQLSLLRFIPLAEKFNAHYLARYPDNPDASKTMTTADVLELDELIILLNENLPCPITVKYRTGLYAAITFSLNPVANVTPIERWIKSGNRALGPLLPRIEQNYNAVMKELYPANQGSGC
jgi:hypothetical protein